MALWLPARSRLPGQTSSSCRLTVERLEDRCLLASGPAPGSLGLLPAVALGVTPQQAAQADVVIDWNATMLRAIWDTATPPTVASRVMAMVGVAVYDAVDGIDPDYTFYPVPGLTARAPCGASAEAAAIAAADMVLDSLYPSQQALFSAEYQATLAGIANGPGTTAGIVWGQTVAQAVLAWRTQDGSDKVVNYTPAPAGGPPGVYELTPAAGLEAPPAPGYLPALSPQWGQVTPWAVTSAAQFLPPPPPALNSAEYAADFNQTKSLGASNSTTRTPDETLFAHFWADVPGHSVTPPGHWDEIAEVVSLQHGLNLEENARLFALLNIGLADAAITCWNAKYIYNFWRPITAIRDPRASQINPATTSDPTWTPLWNTPNFPSYDSGHSTFSGAASTILAALFGPDTHFTVGSDDMPGYTRSFSSFAQAADEAGFSRVVGGIHFEFDNLAGLRSGRELGAYVAANFLLPLEYGWHGQQGQPEPPASGEWGGVSLLFGRGNGGLTPLRSPLGPESVSGAVAAPVSGQPSAATVLPGALAPAVPLHFYEAETGALTRAGHRLALDSVLAAWDSSPIAGAVRSGA